MYFFLGLTPYTLNGATFQQANFANRIILKSVLQRAENLGKVFVLREFSAFNYLVLCFVPNGEDDLERAYDLDQLKRKLLQPRRLDTQGRNELYAFSVLSVAVRSDEFVLELERLAHVDIYDPVKLIRLEDISFESDFARKLVFESLRKTYADRLQKVNIASMIKDVREELIDSDDDRLAEILDHVYFVIGEPYRLRECLLHYGELSPGLVNLVVSVGFVLNILSFWQDQEGQLYAWKDQRRTAKTRVLPEVQFRTEPWLMPQDVVKAL